LPNYQSSITIRDIATTASSEISILGTNNKPSFKRKADGLAIDLSNLHPGDISASGILVIKISNIKNE
jgi:hypothetical protein